MRKEFRKFLEENSFLPLSNWEYFEIRHVKSFSPKDQRQAYSEISRNVGRKNGLYIYEKDGEILYVGKGKPLHHRIKDHYRESYYEITEHPNSKPWLEFFSSHEGRLKIYWRELKGEQERTIIEQILTYVLKPKFPPFKEKYELEEKEKERQR